MATVAKLVNGKLKLVEVEDNRYFVEKLLDSDMYGIYDSITGEKLTWGYKDKSRLITIHWIVIAESSQCWVCKVHWKGDIVILLKSISITDGNNAVYRG